MFKSFKLLTPAESVTGEEKTVSFPFGQMN